MNNLNSILIEGILEKEPSAGFFEIASSRFYKADEVLAEEKTYIIIEVNGRLSEICQDHLKIGKGVRVVGRLTRRGTVYAEHVEFKPTFEKKTGV